MKLFFYQVTITVFFLSVVSAQAEERAKAAPLFNAFLKVKDPGPKNKPSIPIFPGAELHRGTSVYDEAGTRKVYRTSADIHKVVDFYQNKLGIAAKKQPFWYEFVLKRVNLRYKKESYNFLTWGVQIRTHTEAKFTEIAINDFDGAFMQKRGPVERADEEYVPPNVHEPTQAELEKARKELKDYKKKMRQKRDANVK